MCYVMLSIFWDCVIPNVALLLLLYRTWGTIVVQKTNVMLKSCWPNANKSGLCVSEFLLETQQTWWHHPLHHLVVGRCQQPGRWFTHSLTHSFIHSCLGSFIVLGQLYAVPCIISTIMMLHTFVYLPRVLAILVIVLAFSLWKRSWFLYKTLLSWLERRREAVNQKGWQTNTFFTGGVSLVPSCTCRHIPPGLCHKINNPRITGCVLSARASSTKRSPISSIWWRTKTPSSCVVKRTSCSFRLSRNDWLP